MADINGLRMAQLQRSDAHLNGALGALEPDRHSHWRQAGEE